MPVRLSDLQRGTDRTLSVAWEDVTLTLTYQPRRFTGEAEARLMPLASDNRRPLQFYIALIHHLVTGWDLVDDKDRPIPLTEETISKLPAGLLGAIVRRILEDLAPSLASGGTSGDTSSAAGQ